MLPNLSNFQMTNLNTYRLYNPKADSQHLVFRTSDQWKGQVRVTYLKGGVAQDHVSPGSYDMKHDTPEVMDIGKARELWDYFTNEMHWIPD